MIAPLLNLDMLGIAASSGSACISVSVDSSYILVVMGLAPEWSYGSLHLSLGKEKTEEDIKQVIPIVPSIVEKLHSLGL